MNYIIIILLISNVYGNIYMKTFDKPGEYVIKNFEYNYSDEIIVEVIGAGGGGANQLADGGGSGAYIKASIFPKNKDIYIKVGNGGIACNRYYENIKSFHGESSILKIDSEIILLEAGGGLSTRINKDLYSCDSVYIPNTKGIIKYAFTNGIIYTSLDGQNGYKAYTWTTGYGNGIVVNGFGGNGGNTPYGGIGGQGGSDKSSYYNDPYVYPGGNGMTPGGGGGGSWFDYSMCELCNDCCNTNRIKPGGSGGNGTVRIYYTTGIQTTGTQSSGIQTSGIQTTGIQTTGIQTSGIQTTGIQTTGTQSSGIQTSGIQTTGIQTTGIQTTGIQTTGIQTTGIQTTNNGTIIDETIIYNNIIINITVVGTIGGIFMLLIIMILCRRCCYTKCCNNKEIINYYPIQNI
jgi:hypothetical protein